MVLILNQNNPPGFSVNFDGQFNWRWIIHFRQPVYSRPLPSEGGREKECLWWRGWLYTGKSEMDNPFLALVWKRLSVKQFLCPVFLMIAKDCTERLSAVALSVGLIFPRGWCVSDRVVRASFFLRYRDCLGRRRSVREKQGIVKWNCCLSSTCFTKSDISACC